MNSNDSSNNNADTLKKFKLYGGGTITVSKNAEIILPNIKNETYFINNLTIAYSFKDDSEKKEFDDLIKKEKRCASLTNEEHNIIHSTFRIRIHIGVADEIGLSSECLHACFIDKVSTIKFENIPIGVNEVMAIVGDSDKEFNIKYAIDGFRSDS